MSRERGKMRKDELREDEFVEWVMEAVDYVRDRYQVFVGGLIVVILAVLGVDYVLDSQARAQAEADARLGEVLMLEQNGQHSEAIQVMEQVVDKYDGTPAAGQVLIMLGNRRLAEGDFGRAQELYERYLSDYEGSPMLAYAAESGVAAAMEAQGNVEQAALKYLDIAQDRSGSLQAAMALWEAAECYGRLGRAERRQEILERIAQSHDHLPLAARARAALAME